MQWSSSVVVVIFGCSFVKTWLFIGMFNFFLSPTIPKRKLEILFYFIKVQLSLITIVQISSQIIYDMNLIQEMCSKIKISTKMSTTLLLFLFASLGGLISFMTIQFFSFHWFLSFFLCNPWQGSVFILLFCTCAQLWFNFKERIGQGRLIDLLTHLDFVGNNDDRMNVLALKKKMLFHSIRSFWEKLSFPIARSLKGGGGYVGFFAHLYLLYIQK